MEKKYITKVIYGYHLTEHSTKVLHDTNPELFEKFLESDYSIPVDSYSYYHQYDYGFGIIIDNIYPGYIHHFSTMPFLCPKEDYDKMITELHTFFPDWFEDNYIPHIWIMSCIE